MRSISVLKISTMRYIKISIFCLFCFSSLANSQVFLPTDTSESSVKRIRNTINSNREIVNYIEYTFVRNGIPRHLRNLALIESGFNQGSVSSVGASGIWQLMPAHANQYGLETENRGDIYKSTQVAAISLANLYKKYGDWLIVVAAYNCGEGNVAKAMNAAGSKSYAAFYPYLPDETINHVRKYINACYATGELGLLTQASPALRKSSSKRKILGDTNVFKDIDEKSSDPSLVQSSINSSYDLEVTADFLETTVQKILAWNPNITNKLTQKGESSFYLPGELMGKFEANRTTILKLSITK